ncbi:MAG: NADH-ubiquinone oxidoreductase-F iron-sulfur binding region domain-containing protein, partial [Gordonibacter sp.]
MVRLSIAPRASADVRIASYTERFARRVEATPPGSCPLAVQLSLLQASAAQTCGKCVPCRDGLPQLAKLLEQVVACMADEAVLERVRVLAEMARDTSDCAIGYEAATVVLQGLDDFADEYRSHVEAGR